MSNPENPALFEYDFDPNFSPTHTSRITLRDLYIGMAMQSFASIQVDHDWEDDQVAMYSVLMADALLRARKEQS